MSNCEFPNLFSPLTVKGKTFKNRILVSPMGSGGGKEPGVLEDDALHFYEKIAAGGSARVCTGENDVVYGSAVCAKYDLFVDEPRKRVTDSIRAYADVCHKHNALAFTSFDHMGLYCRVAEKMAHAPMAFQIPAPLRADGTPYAYPEKAYGPSEMIVDEPYDGVTSRRLEMDNDNGKHIYAMTEDMMNEIADAFAHCAKVAKSCGLDGMVIHSGHGFLFSQWIADRWNKRKDEYGGSMENRARFPIMCLQRIRQAVGEDFIIEMRFSAEEDISPICDREFIPGTVTIEQTVEFFKEIDKYPGLLDIAHITGGLHTVPIYNTRVTANSYFPMGVNVKGAAAVKAAVKNIKVGVVGSLSDPALCEEIIRDGKADFVILCRQLLIADPEFPNKAREGRSEWINNCLRCTLCRASGCCAVNPTNPLLGENDPLYLRKTSKPLHVAVVGGGIAGMKAAEYAAEAGHQVTLFEKTDRLGGILLYTDNEPFKQDIKRFKDNMILRLGEIHNLEIRLNTEATPEMMKNLGVDAVIVAIGGHHAKLPVPGADGKIVMDSVNSYLSPEQVGPRVAIVGGGLTGCEAAIHWAHQGKQVTLVSRSAELMPRVKPRMPADGSPDTHLIWLNRLKVNILTGCACKEITDTGLYANLHGETVFVEADTVIDASGMRPDPDGIANFAGTAPVVKSIGDCTKAALIGDAVLAAKRAVVELGHA